MPDSQPRLDEARLTLGQEAQMRRVAEDVLSTVMLHTPEGRFYERESKKLARNVLKLVAALRVERERADLAIRQRDAAEENRIGAEERWVVERERNKRAIEALRLFIEALELRPPEDSNESAALANEKLRHALSLGMAVLAEQEKQHGT